MQTNTIRVSNFSQKYDQFQAVTNLSFQTRPGQIVGLLGPNGAGKTTTLKVLAGVLHPTQGKISLCGYDLSHNSIDAKKLTGFVPDFPSAMGLLTVWEHVMMQAALYKIKKYKYLANHLLDMFDLHDKKNKIARELSLGMRQKLSICCNYLIEPKILLFDEPLTGLDPEGIFTLEKSIKQHASEGTTIIISSHLLSVVQSLCTDVLIMDKGYKLFDGNIPDLMRLVKSKEHQGNENLESAFLSITKSKLG